MIIFLQIAGGLALLFFGGEALVRGAIAIARRLEISPLIIGLTIVAFGTSAPEMVVSYQAAYSNHPDIAVGNVIGSNISNILLVLGMSALIYPVAIHKDLLFDGKMMVISAAVFIFFCWNDAMLTRSEGLILLAMLIGYLLLALKKEKKKRKDSITLMKTQEIEEQIPINLALWQSILFAVGGIVILAIGGDLLVEGSASLARVFSIPEAVIGVTIVAVGSSAPEIATSAIAAFRRHSDIAAGNVVGSNLFNIMAAIPLATFITPLSVNKGFIDHDNIILALVTVMLAFLIRWKQNISRATGGVFFLLFFAYVIFQYFKI